ncbi:MAG: OmpW family outer membrane protein [Bacteriovoracaceae bacterium]
MKFGLKKMLVTALVMSSSLNAFADHWMVRTRAITVMPEVSGKAAGSDVKIANDSIPEIDFTYFISKNFALELILGTTTHNVSVGTSSLGSVSLLPPTLLAQYHHEWGNFKPYVGAGLNYTVFYDAQPGDADSMKYDNSFAYAFQVGLDYKISEKVYLNLDVKKLKLSTDVTAKIGGNKVKADVDIDPLIVGVGIGYRF